MIYLTTIRQCKAFIMRNVFYLTRAGSRREYVHELSMVNTVSPKSVTPPNFDEKKRSFVDQLGSAGIASAAMVAAAAVNQAVGKPSPI